MRRNDSAVARLRAVLGPGLPDVGQSLVALGIALLASLVAGLTLGAITGTLEDLPGLLILIPAAIGLRGTIFGALGARLGTAIHSGTFRVSGRADTVLGQNVLAAGALTIFASVVLAVLAKVVSVGFGLEHSISVADFVVISLVGGFISSVVVLGLTVLLSAGSVRYGWDPDNVTAPLVTASGDMITLPALFLATLLVDVEVVTPLIAAAGVVAAVVAISAALSARLLTTRRIVRESVIVVIAAGVLSLIAGQTPEQRLADLAAALIDLRSPGPLDMALLALFGGFLATSFAVAIAYYGAVVSYRLGVDPDNVGIPLVTSSLDLIGSVCFILAVFAVGAA